MSPAEQITRQLRGQWHGSYGSARCPAHDDHHPSLSLADGEGGRILLKCHRGCSYAAIRAALNLPDTPRPQGRHAAMSRTNQTTAHNEKRARQARSLWESAQSLRHSPAEWYLMRRGITCPLPYHKIRYLAGCWHPSAKRLPALISYVSGGAGFAVHRTYLAPDGSGKATVSPSKAMLGQTNGGAVRLAEGSGPLVVAEGLENALCGLLPYPAPSVWAALSASGMAALRLPHRPGVLVIASDGDAAGRTASAQLALRADALGWQVSLMPAPEGQDWNDILCEKSRTYEPI
jgi:hypothetical protein